MFFGVKTQNQYSSKGSANIFRNGQIVSILGLNGRLISGIQLCHNSVKAGIEKMCVEMSVATF